MALREDLIESAVQFLNDPSVIDSPLNKRIEFIESKGLNQEEIQEAIRRSQETKNDKGQRLNRTPVATNDTGSLNNPQMLNDYYYYSNPPPLPERNWKDYFIMATTTVGVSYGLYQVVKKYVIPNILPPSKTQLEKDKEAIDLEFQRIEKLLDFLEKQQTEFISRQDEVYTKVDDTLLSIEKIVKAMNEKNLSNEDSLKYLKLEVENIKSAMMNNLDSQKSTIVKELSDIEIEVNELKKIISAATNNGTNNTESLSKYKIPPISSVPKASDILKSPSPTTNGNTSGNISGTESLSSIEPRNNQNNNKQGIPAWQLAAQQNDS
ncbi:hypothetical protein PACTADRAFT_46289 [Pachysolen tannophilus NRRL Y-2460]|uniref:Peroxisomal membrane protein PEX14 n=1 Tax=Pachysolen tannophilus NRRL Y-2460 TaxID=669874 RepID=A0A1E4TNU5_PACTA|nr:hypothetical protein PACTADRAFT_46289 [Pachysolen tannophilus NRRL Y-2460]